MEKPTKSFWFHTMREAEAFIEGIAFVNDSAITFSAPAQEDEDGRENAWRVDIWDTDAQQPIEAEALFQDINESRK